VTAAAGGIVASADITSVIALTTAKPLVRLVASGTQSLADNTATAIAFTVEDIDTHGFHDVAVNNSRVTPTVSGYYRATGGAAFDSQATPVVSQAYIRKNGSSGVATAGRTAPGAQVFTLITSVIVSLNGSTDYVELIMQQDSAGADSTNQSAFLTCTLELEFLRSL
jgi:hypothetical protein